jgi:signal transduction histidine kinase/ligand-binding sensor domain-containing protein
MRAIIAGAAWLGLLGIAPARALDPRRDIGQYSHTGWSSQQGAPSDIKAMAQTPDGLLWLGTSSGLYTFDGVRFRALRPARADPSRSNQITALLATRSGDVWVGYDWGGMALYHKGELTNVSPDRHVGSVLGFAEGDDGAIWVAGENLRGSWLRRYTHGRWTMIGEREGVPTEHFQMLAKAPDGTLWLTLFPSILRLRPGQTRFETVAEPARFIAASALDRQRHFWLLDDNGLRVASLRPGPTQSATSPHLLDLGSTSDTARQRQLLVDREGSLWLLNGTRGISRIPAQEVERGDARLVHLQTLTAAEGLTGDRSYAMLEDREGNIWVGGQLGLDRFRDTAVVTGFFKPSLRSSLRQGRDGSLFVAAGDGVYRLKGAQGPIPMVLRRTDIVTLCVGGKDNFWIGSFDGVTHYTGPRQTPQKWKDPPGGHTTTSCVVDGKDGLWANVRPYLMHFSQGRWTRAEQMLGHPSPSGRMLRGDGGDGGDGVFIYRSLHDISHIHDGREEMLWQGDQISIGSVKTFYPGPGGLLAGGEMGLARYDGRRFVALGVDQYPWLSNVTGIVQRGDGDTWLISDAGIIRLRTAALDAAFAHPGAALDHDLYGLNEGLRSGTENYDLNNIAQDETGLLWLVTNKGLAWIDPARLSRNTLPPPVLIEAMHAADRTYLPGHVPLLPAGTANVQIDYTATSLADPLHMQFRYRLAGVDEAWVDPGQRRQAIYTNLAAGHYRFQVIASNNDGVWNKTGAVLEFDIAPAFYQTWAFRALVAVALAALLWLAYSLRMRQVAHAARLRIEERLNERERIARDLHDTLLQGFQGLMLNFQRVADHLPATSEARDLMEHALERGDDVLLEGRERVKNLRATSAPVDLPAALRDLAARASAASSLAIDVLVEGDPILICAPVAEEILQIGSEAIFNAILHAQARQATVLITYTRSALSVCFRDDGVGIDEAIRIAGHREGHFGLIGMRERAHEINAVLDIRVGAGGGTDVVVTVPSAIALATTLKRWRR